MLCAWNVDDFVRFLQSALDIDDKIRCLCCLARGLKWMTPETKRRRNLLLSDELRAHHVLQATSAFHLRRCWIERVHTVPDNTLNPLRPPQQCARNICDRIADFEVGQGVRLASCSWLAVW